MEKFKGILKKEIERIDSLKISKRHEKVIKSFTQGSSPRAIIDGKEYVLFNSNDYLGFRFHKSLKSAEAEKAAIYGVGSGGVRFISGTLAVHKDLERAIAKFHGREDALILSSAFSANLGIIHALIKGQSIDSLVSGNVLVISDELNHRSIIDGIRVANLAKEQRKIFKHLDHEDLGKLLEDNKGRFSRALIITDGIFSMLGEAQNISKINEKIREYRPFYPEGIILVMDDAHGVGCFGETGRGCEEVSGENVDLLIGTFGKAFGVEGGYAVGEKILIDYLRESVATYIYSNPPSPGSSAAAIESIKILNSPEGRNLLEALRENIKLFKAKMNQAGFKFAADSNHPIQPILIGSAEKAKLLVEKMYDGGIAVTSINYPVVPKGFDEIRVQICALHSKEDILNFVSKCTLYAAELSILNHPEAAYG
ncbi:hypothetical protein AUJ84_02060 [Candidatus Pacearchaeota archaeon CG1_02_32_132]|nr:MAG: hypothetical protein AUJ84_02060 [Candidatus Pacearchaeota archaeon CG1_02_32_132]